VKKTIALAIAALTITACSASAAVPPTVEQPTPQVIEKIVEVPGPVQVERVEVPVTPESCRVLIGALIEGADVRNDILILLYDAYLDYPNEDLTDFGRRAERILAESTLPELPGNFQSLVDECLGATAGGSAES